MKFIINTAVDPHFCCLFDAQDKLIEKHSWENHRLDGAETYAFLKKHNISEIDISFIGGVTGPGGFSSLRVSSGILNALSFAKKIPIHSVRADIWIAEFLGHTDFILNSFSSSVWEIQGNDLIRENVEVVAQKYAEKPLYVGLLPDSKQEPFSKRHEKSFDHAEITLLQILQTQTPHDQFLPDYEVPPV